MYEFQYRPIRRWLHTPLERGACPLGVIAGAAQAHASIGLEVINRHAKNHAAVVESELGLAADLCGHGGIACPPALHAGLRGDGGVNLVGRCVDGDVVEKISHGRSPGGECQVSQGWYASCDRPPSSMSSVPRQ